MVHTATNRNGIRAVAAVVLWLVAGFEGFGEPNIEIKKFSEEATGKPELVLDVGHNSAVAGISFAPDGSWLATASWDGTIRIWDAKSLELLRVLSTDQRTLFTALAVSPNGQRLASGDDNGDITVWDPTRTKAVHVFEGFSGGVTSVEFSPDGRLLASGGEKGDALVWDLQAKKVVHALTVEGYETDVSFSPDGQKLATGAATVQIWDVATGKMLGTLTRENPAETEFIRAVAWSPNGKQLASAGTWWVRDSGGSSNGEVRIWDVDRSKLVQTVADPIGLSGLAWSPDGHSLATTDGNGSKVNVWNPKNGKQLRAIENKHAVFEHLVRNCTSFAYSPDSSTLAVGYSNGEVKLWPLDREGSSRTIANQDRMHLIAFHKDQHTIAERGVGSVVRLWDIRDGSLRKVIRRPDRDAVYKDPLLALDVSPKDHRVAAGSLNGQVTLSDPETLLLGIAPNSSHVVVARNPRAAAFSPDGGLLAVARHDGLMFWNVSGDKPTRLFRKYDISGTAPLAFSPDGKTLACVKLDFKLKGIRARVFPGKSVTLANVDPNKRPFGSLPHMYPVKSIEFSPDGKYLATGAGDRTSVWDATMEGDADDGVFRPFHLRKSIRTFTVPSFFVEPMVFSPDGAILVTNKSKPHAYLSDELLVWNVNSGRLLHSLPIRAGRVFFSKDGGLLIVEQLYSRLRYFRTDDWQLAATSVVLCNDLYGEHPEYDWITYTPDGYYNGSPSAEAFLRWRMGDELKSAETHAEEFRKPDKIRRVLHGRR